MPWGLLLKLLFMLPSLIPTISKIYKLIKQFEGGSFWEIVGLLKAIIDLILGLAPVKASDAHIVANQCLAHAEDLNERRKVGKLQVSERPSELVELKAQAENWLANA